MVEPCHIIMTTIGSSGDVHPFVGIGRLLVTRGHRVTILTNEAFEPLVTAEGIGFKALGTKEQYETVMADPNLWHRTRGIKCVMRLVGESLRELYDLIDETVEGARQTPAGDGAPNESPNRSRIVLVGHSTSFATRCYEDRYQLPAATVHLAPSAIRSVERPSEVNPGGNLGRLPRWLKRCLWWAVDRLVLDRAIKPTVNRFRAELGLPPVSRLFQSWINSPQRVIGLFPDWFAPPPRDWPEALRLTGFPLFDETGHHQPDAALEAFLNAGDPPIAFTPGSANNQAARFFASAVGATAKLGRRALLLTPYIEQLPQAPDSLPDHVLHVNYTPLSQTLPRCAALVHHGGIGTCSQALRAGVPQLVMPLGFDQPDNVTHLHRLGVGDWLLPGKFTVDRLAEKLGRLLGDSAVADACKNLSARVASQATNQAALEATCDLIEAQASAT